MTTNITPLPTAPSRADPTNFRTRADAFMAALETLATEINAWALTNPQPAFAMGGAITNPSNYAANFGSGALTAGTGTFSGNVTLGDATGDTVTVSGYMGVGGAGNSTLGLRVGSTALTGTAQIGIYSLPVATSAATAYVAALIANAGAVNSAFSMNDAYGLLVENGNIGALVTLANQYGILISDQTKGASNYGLRSQVSSGANKWNIYASGTAQNAFAGNVRIGSAVAPTVALDVTGAFAVSGAATFAGIGTTASAANAFLDSGASNNLLRSTSSLRYKTDLVDMTLAEARNVALGRRAFSYTSNSENDNPATRWIGYGAEEIEPIDPRFVTYDAEGLPNWVQYERFVVPHGMILDDHEARLVVLESTMLH